MIPQVNQKERILKVFLCDHCFAQGDVAGLLGTDEQNQDEDDPKHDHCGVKDVNLHVYEE